MFFKKVLINKENFIARPNKQEILVIVYKC